MVYSHRFLIIRHTRCYQKFQELGSKERTIIVRNLVDIGIINYKLRDGVSLIVETNTAKYRTH